MAAVHSPSPAGPPRIFHHHRHTLIFAFLLSEYVFLFCHTQSQSNISAVAKQPQQHGLVGCCPPLFLASFGCKERQKIYLSSTHIYIYVLRRSVNGRSVVVDVIVGEGAKWGWFRRQGFGPLHITASLIEERRKHVSLAVIVLVSPPRRFPSSATVVIILPGCLLARFFSPLSSAGNVCHAHKDTPYHTHDYIWL